MWPYILPPNRNEEYCNRNAMRIRSKWFAELIFVHTLEHCSVRPSVSRSVVQYYSRRHSPDGAGRFRRRRNGTVGSNLHGPWWLESYADDTVGQSRLENAFSRNTPWCQPPRWSSLPARMGHPVYYSWTTGWAKTSVPLCTYWVLAFSGVTWKDFYEIIDGTYLAH